MNKLKWLEPGDQVTSLAHIFGTPVVVRGRTWLPFFEVPVWLFMAWVGGQRRPGRNRLEGVFVTSLTTLVVVACEWCHNFAHAAAARWVGKPMDALRIAWGTPLVIYFNPRDPAVAPRQHILRALGGPVFNGVALLACLLPRRRVPLNSVSKEIIDSAAAANGFLLAMSLLPVPGVDGGPILKWSLVSRGRSPEAADREVRKIDGILGAALGLSAVIALKRRRWLPGIVLAQLAAFALGAASGIVREQ